MNVILRRMCVQLSLLVIAFSSSGWAIAQRLEPTARASVQATSPASTSLAIVLSVREIYDKLHATGYDQIRGIRWSDSRYKSKVWNSNGQDMALYVNAYTGELERRKARR